MCILLGVQYRFREKSLNARLNLYNNFDDEKKNSEYNPKIYNNIAIYLQKE